MQYVGGGLLRPSCFPAFPFFRSVPSVPIPPLPAFLFTVPTSSLPIPSLHPRPLPCAQTHGYRSVVHTEADQPDDFVHPHQIVELHSHSRQRGSCRAMQAAAHAHRHALLRVEPDHPGDFEPALHCRPRQEWFATIDPKLGRVESTAQHSTAQHSTAQHSMQHRNAWVVGR